MAREEAKPLILITGGAGGIGTALHGAFADDFRVVAMDLKSKAEQAPGNFVPVDLTNDDSVELALNKLAEDYGRKIASVIHLAAYFDFSGEDHPLYRQLNVEGTRRLLQQLQAQDFAVEQFVFSSTMLVHKAGVPGEHIDEETPIRPRWAYPQSKAETEAAIREAHGTIPVVLLRLAGLYSAEKAVPTLSHQIARIYERRLKGHLYAGDLAAGQSMLHEEDLIEAFVRTVKRRRELSDETAILIGEPDPPGYDELQDEVGRLIHGEGEWSTLSVPKPIAKAGAWLESESEPLVPDDLDHGEKPFIRPFMIEMADDHYALDVSKAKRLLGWEPKHDLRRELPRLVAALKRDPLVWYKANGITPPDWMESAAEVEESAERLRRRHEEAYRAAHARNIWGAWFNIGMASWLIFAPPLQAYRSDGMIWSDVLSGLVLLALGCLSLSWRLGWARWAAAGVGCWLLFAPLVFWAPEPAAYLNGTLIGGLVIGFAVGTRPPPGVSPVAATSGPVIPLGWDYSPSSWFQRLPIIILAFGGLYISRYLTAYQLGHIEAVWDPFFSGGEGPKNGTEEIITSSVSEAWPVPDAGVGALAYMLEILVGIVGSSRRWRTMPWLVLLFGIMIVPLGVVSIVFIIIQPIVIGTWCTLCLLQAFFMLLQIPYSLDELVATGQFLRRRVKAGRPFLRVLLVGDRDEGERRPRDEEEDSFEQSPGAIAKDMLSGGIGLPWSLVVSATIGVWLMFTRSVLGNEGAMADVDHVIGALVITVSVTALAEVARAVRFVNMLFGAALLLTPFLFGADWVSTLASLACGLALILLSIPRGAVRCHYAGWNRYIV